MKTKISISKFKLVALLLISFLILTSCEKEETAEITSENLTLQVDSSQNRASGPSANGHGTLTFDGIPVDGEGFRQFSFHAREKNNGSVQGSGVLNYTGGVRNVAFDIDCLQVIGNLAIMSGVTTRDNQFPENVGALFFFEVIDNGEGANSAPDQISLYYQGTDPATYNCSNFFDVPKYDIEGGNVQVRE